MQLRIIGMCGILVLSLTGVTFAQYGPSTASPMGSSAPSAPNSMSPPMGMKSAMPTTGDKHLLVNDKGMTLYTFERDTSGGSNCYGKCATVWPPLLTPKDATAAGKFTIITRKDGAKQWAYEGKPLYLYGKDTAPGMVSGNDVNDFDGVWHTVTPSP